MRLARPILSARPVLGALVLAALAAGPARAQVVDTTGIPPAEVPTYDPTDTTATPTPPPAAPSANAPGVPGVRVLGVSVQGVENEATRNVVLQASGLRVDQTVALPTDLAIADAVRRVYRLGQFSDVRVVEERRVGDGVFLAIVVAEAPRLNDLKIQGVKSEKDRDALRAILPFVRGARLTQTDLRQASDVAEGFFQNRGYVLADVQATRTPAANNAGVDLTLTVNRGPRVPVGEFRIEGNERISDRKLRGQIKDNRTRGGLFTLFRRSVYRPGKLQDDVDRILRHYNEQGFYDARVVSDTAYLRPGGKPAMVVALRVEEGARYHVRNVVWEGNTVFSDDQLSRQLGFARGDVLNTRRLEENLQGNRQQTDVRGLYNNQGYMLFQAQPQIRVIPGDSVDVTFDVYEGDVFAFGSVTIAGNDKTKEHVIRRELYTVPGQTFSRDAVIESVRRLSQLNYFDAQGLQRQPESDVDAENKEVDLTYRLAEVGGDQLELSGTYSGYLGLILQLGVTFNNFSAQNLFNGSAWRPLPMGDGQQLSLRVQTSGLAYQSYSVSFTEPWFRGRPTPVGFAVSFLRADQNRFSSVRSDSVSNILANLTGRVFYNRRLKWPDDKFDLASSLSYRRYRLDEPIGVLPRGVSQEISVEESLSRNSLDNPLFPRRGTQASFSVEAAPPIPGFIQYHKWGLKTNWNAPLSNKVTLGLTTNYGYIGSFNSDPVQFQRYLVGGSPLDAQGYGAYGFGRELIFTRGYPAESIGPRRNGTAVGGRILNKYTSELRWMAVQSPQLQAAPYLFADAVNTWDGFQTFNPAQLYRAAGVGVRLFLPILGMVEVAYGYNFDRFQAASDDNGLPRWRFQFSIGQGFNQ